MSASGAPPRSRCLIASRRWCRCRNRTGICGWEDSRPAPIACLTASATHRVQCGETTRLTAAARLGIGRPGRPDRRKPLHNQAQCSPDHAECLRERCQCGLKWRRSRRAHPTRSSLRKPRRNPSLTRANSAMSVQSSPPGHSALTVLRRLREVALVIQKPIALDPGIGGCSVGDLALQAADIIISTTGAIISGAIRIGTSSVVSHGALYCGSGSVIEAIGQGVVSRSIYDSLADDALAVAYRHPAVTSSIAAAIVAFASSHIGEFLLSEGRGGGGRPHSLSHRWH